MHFCAQQLHQDHTHDCHRHGHGANDFHAKALFRDEGKSRQRPHKAEQHFVDAGKGWMPRSIPAVRHRAGVGQKSRPGRQRGKLHIGIGAGHSKAEVERACSGVENKCGKKQIRFAE